MSKKNRRLGYCIYCGQKKIVTDDHVPPKCLFKQPRPGGLIKVPSCSDCHSENNEVSKDDEYFKCKLTMKADVFSHPDVQGVLPSVYRVFRNPKKIRFAHNLIKDTGIIELIDKGGNLVGLQPVYDVDFERIYKVINRITLGIFFHEKKVRLTSNYSVFSFSGHDFQFWESQVVKDLKDKILLYLYSQNPIVVGNNVFSYRFMCLGNDPNELIWMFLFYAKVAFFSLSYKKNNGYCPDLIERFL